MSKKCELTGKNPLKGHNVSHAIHTTKRRFMQNLKNNAKVDENLLRKFAPKIVEGTKRLKGWVEST